MNYLLRTILLASLLFPSYSFAAQCVKGDLIEDPDPFIWTPVSEPEPHFVGTMEIAEADLVINGETITTRVYRQEGGCNSIPGPTVTMVPGNKYVMKFRNLLTYEPASEEHNVFRDPNVSNLHTHGLHISGESPGDDVTRSFEGQTGGDFVYDIPDNHMGGTFWYHAHHHGSTYLQVSAGAFGLIVIDDQGDKMVIGDQVEPIPQRVADMEERQLVVAYLDPAVKGTGGDTLISGSLSPTWTVNGQVNGAMEVPYGTWHHWRVLLADRDAKEKTFSVGTGCEIALMARDGVWRTEVPKLLPTNSISLTGASRADLAVNCTANSNISVGGLQVASINVDQGNADSGPSPFNAEDTTGFLSVQTIFRTCEIEHRITRTLSTWVRARWLAASGIMLCPTSRWRLTVSRSSSSRVPPITRSTCTFIMFRCKVTAATSRTVNIMMWWPEIARFDSI